jgi:hypothetical protein
VRLRLQDKNVFDIGCNCVMFAPLVSKGARIGKHPFDRRRAAFLWPPVANGGGRQQGFPIDDILYVEGISSLPYLYLGTERSFPCWVGITVLPYL